MICHRAHKATTTMIRARQIMVGDHELLGTNHGRLHNLKGIDHGRGQCQIMVRDNDKNHV